MDAVNFSGLVASVPCYHVKVWLASSFAESLVKIGNVDGAVKVVSALPDSAWRLQVLSDLAFNLAANGDCEGALKIFVDIKDDDIVLEQLLEIRTCVDENVERTLNIYNINGERVRQAVTRLGNYELLDWFRLITKAGRVEEALEALRKFEENHYRAEGLFKVAIALAEMEDQRYREVLGEAQSVADRISDEDYEDIVSDAAEELASVGKGDDALDLAHNIYDDYWLAETLINCLQHFEGELFETTANDILEIIDILPEYEKHDLLSHLFSVAVSSKDLNKPLLKRVIEETEPEPFRGVMQIVYASRLKETGDEEVAKLYKEGMENLRKVKREQRSEMALVSVPLIPSDLIDEFVKYVKEIPDIRSQAMILREISSLQTARGEIDNALKTARSIPVTAEVSASLFCVVGALSKKDFERALNIAGEIQDKNWREASLSVIFADALERGEFKEDFFKKILSSQVRGNEKDALLILEPLVNALVKSGRKELEEVVKLVLELNQLKTMENTLKFLVKDGVEDALKAARGGLGIIKSLALSAVAIKAYKSRVTVSLKRILEEAMKEAKRIKVLYEVEAVYTGIASVLAAAGKVEDAIKIILDKVPPNAQIRALSVLFTLMPVVGRVDDVIRFLPRAIKEIDLPLLEILIHLFEEGCTSEFEKLVDSLISHDFFPLSELIYYFGVRGETEWLQKLVEKEKDAVERLNLLSELGLTHSVNGKIDQAKKAFEKAVEELEKISEEDRKYEAYTLMAHVLMSTDKSCVDLVKNHLDPEGGRLLSTLFEAYKHASEGRVGKTQKIFREIIDNHPDLEDILDSLVTVAGLAKGKTSTTLFQELEPEILKFLEKESVPTILLHFILAGGDPEAVVKMVEKNWGRSGEILEEIAYYLAVSGKIEMLIKIVECANQKNKETILKTTALQMAKHNPDRVLELAETLPAYTKDRILEEIVEVLAREERIEDAINTTRKIGSHKVYIKALTNILLTFIEKTAKIQR
ncbi:MAG: hypothetical protein KIH09_15945 [Candidatus Freyarchaeota archaeon]|nr:hypothetical protein [Candidatus Jordarchaeia archaeon]